MPSPSSRTNRRDFLKNTTLAGVGVWICGPTVRADSKSSNEKLNIAVIGAGGKGAVDTDGCSSQNIVALCDVDDHRAGKTFEKYPQAQRFKDFRKMLEERKDIDAVVVSTPDHTHAVASIMAMKLGKHVYCQKPLTHTIYEARQMRKIAAEQKVATQMGNQGTATDGIRRAAEIVQAGGIGPVRQVHVWTDRPVGFWTQGMTEPAKAQAVPQHLDWDLWLGPAPHRDYNQAYVPFAWRGWWDFGTGALGDMACHNMNLAFLALKLGLPKTVEAEASVVGDQSPPKSSIIRFQFPARGDQPEVKLTWYDGGNRPPAELGLGENIDVKNGILLVGDEGTLASTDAYGSGFKCLPQEKFAQYKGPEKTLPRSPGHYEEWIAACKGGPKAMSNFDYAAPMTEAVLLGNVALRVGKKIEWDPATMSCKDCPEADQYIRTPYRKGWQL